MEYEPQDFTGIHVWYQDKAWVVKGHNPHKKTVALFNPDDGDIEVLESEIAPKK